LKLFHISCIKVVNIVIETGFLVCVYQCFLFCAQVVGHKEGLSVMEKADPLILLVGLPTIPIMLILGKMVRWEDSVLAFLRRNSKKVPLLKRLFPSCG
jgi:E3 ubiquitin-protein ligase MARCH5